MKKLFYTALFLAMALRLSAQADFVPDTLLNEDFEEDIFMESIPSGNDEGWVNYDQDGMVGSCIFPGTTPDGWYREKDLGDTLESGTNYCFSSCSYFDGNPSIPARNWLITPPVFIPDSNYLLVWKSLSYYGLTFLDGYRVLVSTTSNLPASGDFSQELFKAAEWNNSLDPDNAYSLNPADHSFSPGYVHANTYTDSNFFFIDFEAGEPFNHGKLEPHQVDLAGFAGQTVYLAFQHRSNNGFILQLDDIAVVDKATVSAPEVYAAGPAFTLFPNPAGDRTELRWIGQAEGMGKVRVIDLSGRIVREDIRDFSATPAFSVDLQNLSAGTYFVQVQTGKGLGVRRLAKL